MSAPDSRWEARVSNGHVLAGRLGGRLRQVAPLRRCLPLRPASGAIGPSAQASELLLAISGERLFAVVDPRCLHRAGYGRAAIIAINLKTRSWSLLIPIPAGAIGLAAAEGRLAVTLASTTASPRAARATVVVYDTHTQRRLFRISVPQTQERVLSLVTAVDSLGDVLVTVTNHHPPPSTQASSGWWATPRSPAAHALPALITTGPAISSSGARGEPPRTGAAALSDGRVAYATGSGYEGERIEVLNVRNRRTRTVIQMRSEMWLLGLDFAGDALTWAQQSAVPEGSGGPVPGGGTYFSCVIKPLGPAELRFVDLRSVTASGLVVGEPLPAADQPPCTQFEK